MQILESIDIGFFFNPYLMIYFFILERDEGGEGAKN